MHYFHDSLCCAIQLLLSAFAFDDAMCYYTTHWQMAIFREQGDVQPGGKVSAFVQVNQSPTDNRLQCCQAAKPKTKPPRRKTTYPVPEYYINDIRLVNMRLKTNGWSAWSGVFQLLVVALILSRLDYCNSVLVGNVST